MGMKKTIMLACFVMLVAGLAAFGQNGRFTMILIEALRAQSRTGHGVLVVNPDGTVRSATLNTTQFKFDPASNTLQVLYPTPANVTVPKRKSLVVTAVNDTAGNFTGWSPVPDVIVPGSLQVFRNGVAMAETLDYTYDTATRRITFTAGQGSAATDIVLVTYCF